MRTLSLIETENVIGGISNSECMLRGAGIAVTGVLGFVVPGFWGATAVLITTSADCYGKE